MCARVNYLGTNVLLIQRLDMRFPSDCESDDNNEVGRWASAMVDGKVSSSDVASKPNHHKSRGW
jgi:hypothetical protein